MTRKGTFPILQLTCSMLKPTSALVCELAVPTETPAQSGRISAYQALKCLTAFLAEEQALKYFLVLLYLPDT